MFMAPSRESQLVRWCFEPSQPQRVKSGPSREREKVSKRETQKDRQKDRLLHQPVGHTLTGDTRLETEGRKELGS